MLNVFTIINKSKIFAEIIKLKITSRVDLHKGINFRLMIKISSFINIIYQIK